MRVLSMHTMRIATACTGAQGQPSIVVSTASLTLNLVCASSCVCAVLLYAGTLIVVGGISAALFANAIYTPSTLCDVPVIAPPADA